MPPFSYGLSLRTKLDNLGTYVGADAALRDGRIHRIVVEWSQETGSNTLDGVSRLIVDGSVILEKTDVATSSLPVTSMELGIKDVTGDWQAVTYIDNVKVFSTFAP